jgi:isopenicillin N synthase-like dioxygenase
VSLEIPSIDIASLSGGDAASRAACAQLIRQASIDVGFFYVIGHGLNPHRMAEVIAAAKRFFAQPLAEKMAFALSAENGFRGYFPLEGEITDPAIGADPKEGFDVSGLHPPSAPQLWPANPPELRAVLSDYYDSMCALGRMVSRGFALALDLPEDFFADKLDQPTAILRILHYPPIAPSSVPGALPPTGCGAHSDYGYLTILAQDEQGGLQVQTRAGAWIDVPPRPNSFVCNIGEMMEMWTDGLFRATPHRVIRRAPASRYSVPFFFHPNPNAVIGHLPGAAPSARAPITSGDYLLSRQSGAYTKTPVPTT